MSADAHALREAVVQTCRDMSRLGVAKGTSGNVGVRHGEGFLISPTGIAYDQMRPEQVVQVYWDGSFDGDTLPSSEWRFHRDILFHRREFNAIVHTHSMYATALSIHGRGIPAIHYRIAAAGGPDIRCADYATFGEQALSDSALKAMEGRKACLLAHHGVIAAEISLPRALALAVTVEELAQQYLLSLTLGAPPLLDDDEITRVLVKFRSYGQQRPG
ncbi:MAG: class II aldolase/adducin family protein [Burkholderiaceae bacterium]